MSWCEWDICDIKCTVKQWNLDMFVTRFDAFAYETRAEVILRDMLSLFGIDLEAEGIYE